ncbi:MAG: hypothetical protein K2O08_03090 [Clostridia bacterium]|nr:hypothetical protein [Clostridia bacterium]
MVKSKKKVLLTILLALSILMLCFACCFINDNTANAETNEELNYNQTRGLVTRISIDIGSYGDSIWARACNDFTLGFSTIQVYVYLYSSPTFQYTYRNMKLEAIDYIADLNIGKKLEVTAPIDGVERYWRARVKYRMDNKDWVEEETQSYLVNADGMLL